MAKVIVAGGKGFIGKRLVKELSDKGNEVLSLDMGDKVEAVNGEWDVFFNMAWVGKGGVLRADYNVQMSNVKVALDFYGEAQRLKCKRYICMGTIGEKMARLPECKHIKSQNLIYAISKNYLHDILNTIESINCKVVWATLGNIYGGEDAGGNIIDYCLRCILRGEVATFGPAEQPYDFIHVDDAVRAIALIGMSSMLVSNEFYVGNGTPRPLKNYLYDIGRITGHESLIGIGKRPDDGTRYKIEWFDIKPLEKETGFSPVVIFDEGVKANLVSLQERTMI